MTDALIKVENVSKKFCRSLKKSLWYGMQDLGRELIARRHGGDGRLRDGEFWAVNDVSFEVEPGECLGLIGRNGAGKTTLLRMLNGLIKPDAGRIEMQGRVGALIALGAGFNPVLTGRENVFINAAVLGMSQVETKDRLDEITDFAEIGDFIDAPVQSYSSGMVVRLGFAIAAKSRPHILLLDELLAVGDIGFQAKCFNALSEFRESGIAFILISHNMHQISRYAERVLYLKKGLVAYYGDVEQGIALYQGDMQQSDLVDRKEHTDWSRVYGSGKVIFTGARFRDAAGAEVSEINVNDPVTLEIDYEPHAPGLNSCMIDVLARDREGAVVLQERTTIVSGHLMGLRARGQIRMTASFIPINTGYLEFFFCALNEKTGEIYDWKRNFRLLVVAAAANIAKLAIPVRWDCVNVP